MGRALPLLTIALLLAVAPAAEARTSCAAPGTRTVAKNGVARLYEKGRPGAEQLRACLYSRGIGRSVLLAENYDDEIYESGTWDRVRLYRRFAAWRYTRVDSSCKADCPLGYGHGETRTVRDLVSGRWRRRPPDFEIGSSFVLIASRVLITAVERDDGVIQLATWDGSSRGVLDEGDIEPRSLNARGNRVTWVKSGVRRRVDW